MKRKYPQVFGSVTAYIGTNGNVRFVTEGDAGLPYSELRVIADIAEQRMREANCSNARWREVT